MSLPETISLFALFKYYRSHFNLSKCNMTRCSYLLPADLFVLRSFILFDKQYLLIVSCRETEYQPDANTVFLHLQLHLLAYFIRYSPLLLVFCTLQRLVNDNVAGTNWLRCCGFSYYSIL